MARVFFLCREVNTAFQRHRQKRAHLFEGGRGVPTETVLVRKGQKGFIYKTKHLDLCCERFLRRCCTTSGLILFASCWNGLPAGLI